MTKIEEVNRSFDMETQANRATIQQMANQLHVYEQNNVNHLLQIDSIRAERDAALMNATAMRTELEAARGRLDSIHKAWQNTRGELDQRESKYSSFENHVKQVESELLYAKSTLDAFKQQVAQLLSDGFVKVEPKEDEIREKIQLLMQSSKDRGAVSVELPRRAFRSSLFSLRSSRIFKTRRNNSPSNCKNRSSRTKISKANDVSWTTTFTRWNIE